MSKLKLNITMFRSTASVAAQPGPVRHAMSPARGRRGRAPRLAGSARGVPREPRSSEGVRGQREHAVRRGHPRRQPAPDHRRAIRRAGYMFGGGPGPRDDREAWSWKNGSRCPRSRATRGEASRHYASRLVPSSSSRKSRLAVWMSMLQGGARSQPSRQRTPLSSRRASRLRTRSHLVTDVLDELLGAANRSGSKPGRTMERSVSRRAGGIDDHRRRYVSASRDLPHCVTRYRPGRTDSSAGAGGPHKVSATTSNSSHSVIRSPGVDSHRRSVLLS